jgi:orotate phosphoribosyltransferase
MRNDLVQILKPLEIILREPITLASGVTSDFYVDIKKAYGYPKALNIIAEELWERIDKRTTCIATAGYGGLSPATVISSRHNLNLTLVRDEPKKHGKGGWIDGYVPSKQDKVVLIDDVFTTGGSLRKLIKILEPTRAEIIGAYVVVKRGEGDLSVPLTYLLTPEDFLQRQTRTTK